MALSLGKDGPLKMDGNQITQLILVVIMMGFKIIHLHLF